MADRPVVMISSTTLDLPAHRQAALDACLRQGYLPHAMEHLTLGTDDAVTLSLAMVDQAEVYLLILGHRYGEIPAGHEESYTHLELNRALSRGIPVLIFMIGPGHTLRFEDVETGPGAVRLTSLKEDLRRRQQVAFFSSPDDFRAQLIDALAALKPRLAAPAPASLHYVHRLPEPPAPYVAHPYTLLNTEKLVGRQADLGHLTDWATGVGPAGDSPVLVVTSLGGMGKSALTWTWFHTIAPQEIRRLSGRIWWSFYESDASFENFVVRSLAYVSGRPMDEVKGLPVDEREEELLGYLSRRPYLVVLDGLERLLLAYARPDAAYLADDDVEEEAADVLTDLLALPAGASATYTGQSRRRLAADLRVGRFLRRLALVRPSRILISSRLFPSDLQTMLARPVTGAAPYFMEGLTDADALALWRAFGARGSRDEIAPLLKSFGNYPLLIRALAAEVALFRPQPGDFGAWRAAHPSFNPFAIELKQRKSHVLAHALRGVTADRLRLLHVLAAFRMPATYPALTALLMGEGKTFPSEGDLDAALDELEDRGLVGWDRIANRYDLHPIVRGVAWASLEAGAQRAIHVDLAAHFGALPVPDSETATLDDLQGQIEHFHTLVALGLGQEAADLLGDLLPALERLSAYTTLLMLLEIVSAPALAAMIEPPKGQEFLLQLGFVHDVSGHPREALAAYQRFDSDQFDDRVMISALKCRALLRLGRIVDAERANLDRWEERAELVEAEPRDVEWLRLYLTETAVVRGQKDRARRLMLDLRPVPDLMEDLRGLHPDWGFLALRCEEVDLGGRVAALFGHAFVDEADRVDAAFVTALLRRIGGEADTAERALSDLLPQVRAIGFGETEGRILVQLTGWLLDRGDSREAARTLEQLDLLIEHTGHRLFRADALNLRSRLALAEGRLDDAAAAAEEAYRAAWCDGPPFAYAAALAEATAVLNDLYRPVPTDLTSTDAGDLPDFPPPLTVETVFAEAPEADLRELRMAVWRALQIYPDGENRVRGLIGTPLSADRLDIVLATAAKAGTIHLVREFVDHERAEVRAAAAAVLLGAEPTNVEWFVDLMRTDPSPEVRGRLLAVLADRYPTAITADDVRGNLTATVATLRLLAVDIARSRAMLTPADIAALPVDPAPAIRRVAVDLGDTGQLLRLVADPDESVWGAALPRLLSVGQEEVYVEELADVLADRIADPDDRKALLGLIPSYSVELHDLIAPDRWRTLLSAYPELDAGQRSGVLETLIMEELPLAQELLAQEKDPEIHEAVRRARVAQHGEEGSDW